MRPAALNVIALAFVCAASQCAAAEPAAVFTMNVDGGDVRRVATVGDRPLQSAVRWSHDGGRLAFQAAASEKDPPHCYIVGADGSKLTDLGPGALPDWSVDDKQLVFSIGEGTSVRAGVWVQNIDGRGREWLAGGSAPRWNADGSLLAMLHDGQLMLFDLVEAAARPLLDASQGPRATAVVAHRLAPLCSQAVMHAAESTCFRCAGHFGRLDMPLT